MRRRGKRAFGDKLLISVFLLAVTVALGMLVFAIVETATHGVGLKSGARAVVGFVIYGAICFRALRKRWNGV